MYYTIFNPIKYAVDLSLIQALTSANTSDTHQVLANQFNCPGYDNDLLKANMSLFPYILILVSYIFTLVVNLGNIITEKQTKMKVINYKH